MRLFISAGNIRAGGGATHLLELLSHLGEAASQGFTEVHVAASKAVLDKIENHELLTKHTHLLLEGGILRRWRWEHQVMPKLMKELKVDMLFTPAASYVGKSRPFVSFAQNLLPFDVKERARFKVYLPSFLRLKFLEFSQATNFRNANGVIFLSEISKSIILDKCGSLRSSRIIHHGIHQRFVLGGEKPIRLIEDCTNDNPFEILYVSIINLYKHQIEVLESVAALRREGLPVSLRYVGKAFKPALRALEKKVAELKEKGVDMGWFRYDGFVPYEELPEVYKASDLFVMASSCETYGMIATEAMAAGLPLAVTAGSAVSEVSGEDAFYFDPEDVESIRSALAAAIHQPELRSVYSKANVKKASSMTWQVCARETYFYLAERTRDWELGNSNVRA